MEILFFILFISTRLFVDTGKAKINQQLIKKGLPAPNIRGIGDIVFI